MKYLIKTVSLVVCLIMISACEFGKAPDASMLEDLNKAQQEDECDETCQNFYAMIEKKYGTNYEKACDENCIATEWEAYLKAQEDTAKEQIDFNYPDACDTTCQNVFNAYLESSYGNSCDAECKDAEFKVFFDWYAEYLAAGQDKQTENVQPQQANEGSVNEGIPPTNGGASLSEEVIEASEQTSEGSLPTPPSPPVTPQPTSTPATPSVPSTPSTPVIPAASSQAFQVSPEEINAHISKLGFVPDTIVILSPKYLLSSLDTLKRTVVIPTDQQILIDMLPALMTKAKYLLLAYKKNAAGYSLIAVSPDAASGRAIESFILKLYQQATNPRPGLWQLVTNVGFAKLTNAYIAGSPFSQLAVIFSGTPLSTSLRNAAIAPCIAALSGKSFDGFIAKTLTIGSLDKEPDPLLKYFDRSEIKETVSPNAACSYTMK